MRGRAPHAGTRRVNRARSGGAGGNVPATAPTTAKQRLSAFEERLKAAGARLEKVEGHAYRHVQGGAHDGMLLNTSGNQRAGRFFEIVHREGRTHHVYGSGSHRLVIGMPRGTGGTRAS